MYIAIDSFYDIWSASLLWSVFNEIKFRFFILIFFILFLKRNWLAITEYTGNVIMNYKMEKYSHILYKSSSIDIGFFTEWLLRHIYFLQKKFFFSSTEHWHNFHSFFFLVFLEQGYWHLTIFQKFVLRTFRDLLVIWNDFSFLTPAIQFNPFPPSIRYIYPWWFNSYSHDLETWFFGPAIAL